MHSRILKYFIGFFILLLIQYASNLFVKLVNIALPAPILGIIVLSICLHFQIIKKEWIKDICNLLLNYMPLLFVPLFVGIIAYYSLVEKNLAPILVNVIITATLTLIVTAIFVENIIKYVRLGKMKKSQND